MVGDVMRKMVLKLYVMPQIRRYEFFLVPDDMTEKELDDYAWESAVQFAEGYGYYPTEWLAYDEYDDGEQVEQSDNYVDSIEGSWQVYDPKRHDGFRTSNEIDWNKI
jgi:hypothetical protein